MTGPTVVVVGAGQAGAETVAALRSQGHDGGIELVGDEPTYPYVRPPLSKQYLAGAFDPQRLLVRPIDFYESAGVQLHLGSSAERIDRAARRVHLTDGHMLSYDALVIATGGMPRRLPVATGPNVHYLRTLPDAERLRTNLITGSRLVVVGGGYLGLEVAALARTLGIDVTVLEAANQLLARVAGQELAQFVHDRHAAEGIHVRLGAIVTAARTDDSGWITAVQLSGGELVEADAVFVGVGLAPNDELAAAAGLPVDDGVLVDEYCRTADPRVFAVGDCTRHPCNETGGTRRLESVTNASEQARAVAATIVGRPKPYRSVPWFWSDQGSLRLKSVGLTAGCDAVVVRPQSDPTQFAAFHLKNGQVRAADIVNNPKLFILAKRLVAGRAQVSPAQLADPDVPAERLLETTAAFTLGTSH